jgi:hypothetical protein
MTEAPVLTSAKRVIVPSAALALVGLVVWAVALVGHPEEALFAYLAAFVFAVTVVLGVLCLVMITHAAGAQWFVVIRRLAEGVAGTLPLFALLILPVLFGVGRLYPWVPPLAGLSAKAREVIHAKDAYLNVPFFVVRAGIYLAVWSALAILLRRWSFHQDEGRAAPRERAVLVSGLGLMVFAFTVHFAAVDWLMSLSPEWVSTVFGVYVFIGGMVGGVALLVLLTRAAERGGALAGRVSSAHYHALGRLQLVFVIFWAYIAYAQGFLVWIADEPAEAKWYLARWDGGWRWMLWALIVGHFFLPFLALLSRRLKRSPSSLAGVAVWLLALHYVDVLWLVLPALAAGSLGGPPAGPTWEYLWIDLAALAWMVGAVLAFGAWRLAGRPLVPRRDPRLARSMEYQSR